MEDLIRIITTEIARWPEGAPITAAAFLHHGNRPAVSKALRALAKHGEILRVAHGVYVATVVSRFGRHSPGLHAFIQQLSTYSGEAIAPFGAVCANVLGLTTQVPVKIVYWTSGRTRSYKLGKLTVYLQHVPDWQLVLWHEPAGELVRALAWAGPADAGKVLRQIVEKVPEAAIFELRRHASVFPLCFQKALQQAGPAARGKQKLITGICRTPSDTRISGSEKRKRERHHP